MLCFCDYRAVFSVNWDSKWTERSLLPTTSLLIRNNFLFAVIHLINHVNAGMAACLVSLRDLSGFGTARPAYGHLAHGKPAPITINHVRSAT